MRRALPLLLSAAVGVSLASPAVGAEGDPWVTDPGLSAASLRDSAGVGVHMAYDDTPYSDPTKVASALSDLGITHVRDDLFLDDPAQYAAMRTVTAQSGARFDLIMGRPGNGHSAGEYVATAAALGGVVEAFEGPNEWDINGGSGWASDLRSYQSDLWAAAKSAAPSVPVLAPALAFATNYSALGDLIGTSDVANAHVYAGGQKPSTGLDSDLAAVRAHTGVSTTVISETGYHNATASPSGHIGVPDDVAGVYTPRLLLENALRGVSRTYLYELVDEFNDPARVNAEAHFGLLNHDWTPKPAYTALRNTLNLVGTPGAGDGLAYKLSGASGDVRHLLVDRADGTHVLFLWRDASIYDTSTRSRVDPGSVPVTLSLPTSTMLTTYKPTSSAGARTSAPGSSLALSVDATVTAVVLGGPQVAIEQPVTTTPAPTIQLPVITVGPVKVIKPPKVLQVVPGLRAITLRWSSASASRLDHITVTVAGGRTVKLSPDSGVTTLRGLRPGRTYDLLIRGWSHGSASRVSALTAETKPLAR